MAQIARWLGCCVKLGEEALADSFSRAIGEFIEIIDLRNNFWEYGESTDSARKLF